MHIPQGQGTKTISIMVLGINTTKTRYLHSQGICGVNVILRGTELPCFQKQLLPCVMGFSRYPIMDAAGPLSSMRSTDALSMHVAA